MEKITVLKKIKNKIIISSQAAPCEPLYNEVAMNAMIDTIVQLGKVDVLRLAGKRDIKNTKEKYMDDVVVIGITKPDNIPVNFKELVYITPDVDHANEVINAGADIVAFDSTLRNKNAKNIVDLIHSEGKLAMGDIADFEDAKYAVAIGCDIVSTTLSGYTKETENMPDTCDFELIKKCSKEFNIPVIGEGKIWTKEDIKNAFECGAFAVVVGSAVTRPQLIINRLKEGLK